MRRLDLRRRNTIDTPLADSGRTTQLRGFCHYPSEKLTTAIPGRYIGLQKRMGGPRIGIILSLSASRSRGTRQRKVGPVRKAKVGHFGLSFGFKPDHSR